MSLARYFPLPFTCQHEVYTPGVEDDHGNTVPGWLDPVSRPCVWWTPDTAEPATPPTGGDRVTVDVVLVVDSAVTVGHRDRFTIAELLDSDGNPARLEVIGLPKDSNHSPFGFSPDRLVIELKAVF
ncbi:hypothetical protein [Mycolicibacterium conceptionense]|uniref:hypothetical protein n=1 Tax=Mycolicibacterium conceptionense TaxID=451644 RepID=UPI0021F33C7D|nr:hypothetical protein [Mycolicibacterium conceptionense]